MLAIVPARGGSVGVPGKNLRVVAGKPLVIHKLDQLARLREAGLVGRVVCATDDDRIAATARIHGHDVVRRPSSSSDETLTQVARWVAADLEWDGPVGVFQATCPTVTDASLTAMLAEFAEDRSLASMGTARTEHRLAWTERGQVQADRVNRQFSAPSLWVETGAAHLVRDTATLMRSGLVGRPHRLFDLSDAEAHDIDTADDLDAARAAIGWGVVDVHVAAGRDTGTGHVRRGLLIAQELGHHVVRVIPHTDSGELPDWVAAEFAEAGVAPFLADPAVTGLTPNPPGLVIFDMLNPPAGLVLARKAQGAAVVVLECDDDDVCRHADLVINELLHPVGRWNEVTGPRFAVLRPEFTGLPPFEVREEASRALVCFGGSDPAELNGSVGRLLIEAGWEVASVGRGGVAEAMRNADVFVGSAGRMMHEACAVGVPMVAVPVNARERSHVTPEGVLVATPHSAADAAGMLRPAHERRVASSVMRAEVDGRGLMRVVRACENLMEGL